MQMNNWPWKPHPDYTRLLKAIRRQGDANHVPFLELFADREVIAFLLDEPIVTEKAYHEDRDALEKSLDQKIRFWYQLGYDAFWQGPILVEPNRNFLESDDTAPMSRGKRQWTDESAGVVTSWADFESYPWPRAEDADLYPLEYAAAHLPEGMGMFVEIRGVFEFVMELMGYETLSLCLYDQPDLVESMFHKQEKKKPGRAKSA